MATVKGAGDLHPVEFAEEGVIYYLKVPTTSLENKIRDQARRKFPLVTEEDMLASLTLAIEEIENYRDNPDQGAIDQAIALINEFQRMANDLAPAQIKISDLITDISGAKGTPKKKLEKELEDLQKSLTEELKLLGRLTAQVQGFEQAARRACPFFRELEADRQRMLEQWPLECLKGVFVKSQGLNGYDLTADEKAGLSDDDLDKIPRRHIPKLRTEASNIMQPSEAEAKNSASPPTGP